MQCEIIYYNGNENVYLDCYILNSGLKLGQSMARPAVVICPGGGYVYLSPREAGFTQVQKENNKREF